MAAAAAARGPVTAMRALRIASLLFVAAVAMFAQAAGRELAPREYGPTPYRTFNPLIAHTGGKFLTVWMESRGLLGSHVVGALSDASGQPLGPSFTIVREAPASMDLVSTGDAFVLFQHKRGALEMIELDLDGRVTRSRTINVPELISSVAWNGTRFLAVNGNNTITADAQGILLSREGEIVRRRISIAGAFSTPHEIVVDGGDFIVLTAARDGLFADRITSEGAVTRTLIEEFGGFAPTYYGPVRAIGAAADSGLLLLWVSGIGPRGYEVRSTILRDDGTIGAVHRVAATEAAVLPHALSAMRAGDGYVVTFTEPRYGELGEALLQVTALTLDETGATIAAHDPVLIGYGVPAAAAGAGVTVIAHTPSLFQRQRILHRTVDASGTIGDPVVVSVARARQLQPALGAGAGQFLAAFTEIGDTARQRTVAIDAAGEPLRNQFLGEGGVAAKDLSWNGSAYLAIIQRGATLLAQRLTAGGEPFGPPSELHTDEGYSFDMKASVVWSVDRWVVAWIARDGDQAFFATVSPAGIVADKRELVRTAPDRYFVDVALAAGGPRVLVSWIDANVNEIYFVNGVAFAQRFRRDGREIDAAPVRVATGTSYLSATAGDEFVVVTDAPAQTLMTKLDANGPALAVLATRSLPPSLSDITWDGGEYVVASRGLPDFPRHLVVSRFDEQLEPTQAPRGVIVLQPDEHAQPSVAAAAGEVLVAIQEADAEEGARAVVYRESELSALPWPPPRKRSVRH
jgi:hypothetical protein